MIVEDDFDSDLYKLQPELLIDDNEIDDTGFDQCVNFEKDQCLEGGNLEKGAILTGKKLYICVFANCCCLFLVALDQTITMTILSTISKQFSSFSEITWVTTAFVLPLGCLSQIWGKFSIIFGRKMTMLSSMLIFEIGSLVCALANSMNSLIGGRVIQGIGGGGIMSCVYIIASEITTNDKKPILFSLNGAVFAISSVLGPIVGGLLSEISWRWCFWINLCFGGFIIPLFYFSFGSDWEGDKNFEAIMAKLLQIDYIGTTLMVSSLVLLLLGISLGTSYRWNDPACISSFTIGGLLFIAFSFWNFKFSKKPVLPPVLAKIWKLDIACLCLFCGNGLFLATLQFIAIYYQIVWNQTALHSGTSLLSNVMLTTAGTMSIGILMNKTTYVKPWMILSGFLMALGIGLFGILKIDTPINTMIGIQTICGFGFGYMFHPPLVSAQLLAPTPEEDEKFYEKGLVDIKTSIIMSTSFANFSRNIGGAFISELAQVIYTTTLKRKLIDISIDHNIPKSQILILVNNIGYIDNLKELHGDTVVRTIRIAFLNSIKAVFWMTFSFACLVFILAFLMSNKRLLKST